MRTESGGSSHKRVLIIDDDPVVREIVKAKLLSVGIHVLEAANGEEAINVLRGQGRPSLIILDVMMPGMSGFDVCERLRSDPQMAGTPVLFLTSRSERSDRERAMRYGASDLILKPFSPKKLSETVLRIIQSPVENNH